MTRKNIVISSAFEAKPLTVYEDLPPFPIRRRKRALIILLLTGSTEGHVYFPRSCSCLGIMLFLLLFIGGQIYLYVGIETFVKRKLHSE